MKKETALKLIGAIVKPIKKDLITWQDVLAQYKKTLKKRNKNTVISICQHKGGVGKTTSTINLGWLFSQLGKTLLIDLDTQASLSQAHNILIKDRPSLKEFIDTQDKNSIYKIDENLDIIPNTIEFERWKKQHVTKRNSSYSLTKAIKTIKDTYDFIIIDCSPSLDINFDLALYSSDYALVVMDGHPFSMQSLETIVSEINSITQDDINQSINLKLLGIFFNCFSNTNLVNTIIEQSKENYPIFNTKIRDTISIPESQLMRQNIFNYNDTSNASIDYFNLFCEIMEKI